MKKTLLLTLACAALVAGCVAKNPNYQPPPAGQNPATNPQFVADVNSLSNAAVTAHSINQSTAPLNPYSGVTDVAIDGVFGIAAAISLLIARLKSNQAAAHASAIDAMALGAVKAGPTAVQAITDTVANAGAKESAIVTTAINNHTP